MTECGGRKNSTSYSVIEETKQRVLFPHLLISDSSFYRVSHITISTGDMLVFRTIKILRLKRTLQKHLTNVYTNYEPFAKF